MTHRRLQRRPRPGPWPRAAQGPQSPTSQLRSPLARDHPCLPPGHRSSRCWRRFYPPNGRPNLQRPPRRPRHAGCRWSASQCAQQHMTSWLMVVWCRGASGRPLLPTPPARSCCSAAAVVSRTTLEVLEPVLQKMTKLQEDNSKYRKLLRENRDALKENQKAMERLTKALGVKCITTGDDGPREKKRK